MAIRHADRYIDAAPDAILSIIVNIGALADWNPALLSTRTEDVTAVIGHVYPVVTRVPGRATLTYTEASDRRVVWRVEVAGSVEIGEWDVAAERRGSRVTHTMRHSGAVFAALSRAMTEVPNLRLDRLQRRAEERSGFAP